MRGSHDRIHEGSPLRVVTAYASGPAVSLGQTAVAEKSNEITAIPHLVSVLCLTGCIVTIDAPRQTEQAGARKRSPGVSAKPGRKTCRGERKSADSPRSDH